VTITNPQFIAIGRMVVIRPHAWLYAITGYEGAPNVFRPSIEIRDGCSIGRFCHITCSNRLVLEENVFLTEGVLITDSIHGYEDVTKPIYSQPLISRGPIVVGSGTWISNGATVVGKVTIGRNCVIGANAFVNKDVPDYCVVVGIPGRIVRRFDQDQSRWVRTDEPLGEWEQRQ
jgi:acetyltransferase-like isoleucine patch superfamily enzyme